MTDPKIPDKDHLVRTVPFARLKKADGSVDEIIGLLPDAFALRECDNGSLSTSWLEYFPGAVIADKRRSMVAVLRKSDFKPSPKGGFAVGNVARIRNACETKGHQVRIVYDPTPDNPGHASVRRYPMDAWELYEVLASDAWAEWFLNRDVP